MSKSLIKLRESVAGIVGRQSGLQVFSTADLLKMGGMNGTFKVRHSRNGQLIQEYSIPNLITDEGKNHILNVQFHATSPIETWYLGLIDNADFTAVDADDTYDNIDQAGNGWDEFTDYTDRNNSDNAGTRPVWPEDAASDEAITNTTLAIYDFTGSGTLKGLFVAGGTNAATKGDHTAGTGHILWAATPFASTIDVGIGEDLSVTYSVSW